MICSRVITLQLVGDHAQGHSLHFGFSLLPGCTVSHHSGQSGNLRNLPTIVFAFEIDSVVHASSGLHSVDQGCNAAENFTHHGCGGLATPGVPPSLPGLSLPPIPR